MKTIWAILLLTLTVASAAQVTSDERLGPVLQASPQQSDYILSAADWARPRTGEYVVQLPAVRDAVQALDRVPGSSLVIRFPGGEDGTLMAHELKDWLVALGLASDRIRLSQGLGQGGVVVLQVRKDIQP